jgi:hypothetical protein
MELTYATIVVLASMVFVLSAMVGYLYWQQTKMLQNIQALAIVISTQLVPRQEPQEEEQLQDKETEEEEEEEDDRVSVKEEVEQVTGPPEEKKEEKVDIDELQDKTASQLREMLTNKGIPFGKRDSKPVLIQLLKATA